MKLSPDMSRWQFRKNHRKHAASVDKIYISYLQSLLQYNDIMYDSRFAFEHNTTFPIKLEHPLNLERYSEDPKCDIQSQQKVCNVGDTDIPSAIGLHTGHHAVASTTELGAGSSSVLVEAVPNQGASVECEGVVATRDNRDGRQCQLCNRVFSSRNLLFQHLRDVHGELPRTGVDDRAHRRRWKMRARKRAGVGANVGRGGSRAEKRSVASRGGSTDAKVDAVRAAEVQALVEESEKTCIFCEDCTVGKEVRRLSCGHVFHASCSKGIEEWFRCCRSTLGMSPKCPRCNADVDSAVR
mmetsp:Transcript_30761/g.49111  ORF Transcript_30761/g.49111 Transcript_30761/m.49111 type:complete len:297 (-) Transcript_30761:328-1218(-)